MEKAENQNIERPVQLQRFNMLSDQSYNAAGSIEQGHGKAFPFENPFAVSDEIRFTERRSKWLSHSSGKSRPGDPCIHAEKRRRALFLSQMGKNAFWTAAAQFLGQIPLDLLMDFFLLHGVE